MTITGGSGEWDYSAEYTISVSGGAYFTSSDVGAQLQFPYTVTDLVLAMKCQKNYVATLFL